MAKTRMSSLAMSEPCPPSGSLQKCGVENLIPQGERGQTIIRTVCELPLMVKVEHKFDTRGLVDAKLCFILKIVLFRKRFDGVRSDR